MSSILLWARRIVVSAGLSWVGVTVVGAEPPKAAPDQSGCIEASCEAEGYPSLDQPRSPHPSEKACLEITWFPRR